MREDLTEIWKDYEKDKKTAHDALLKEERVKWDQKSRLLENAFAQIYQGDRPEAAKRRHGHSLR